ncbi:hypothetical protein [Nitrogeniibacter aestuarii]|uniref:hypothetical protein n=1 Tax=Nitrogeniibacter aestuarii TaxID=2815343 RepID=UPI001D0FFF56|nr:hypothetical protein [Nitrogeniibacter aestuarii]
MPFPWAIAAKAIPWTEVIAASPAIVKGAKELWSRMRTDPKPGTADDGAEAATPEARLDALNRIVLTLEERNETQTELITRLAEQQAQLVSAIDRAQKRTRLALVVALVAVVTALWPLMFG